MTDIRIQKLLDPGTFVEIGQKVTARATDFNEDPTLMDGDGVTTGHGLVDGNLVFVFSQDADSLGGTLGEMHAKKICILFDMAMKVGAPVVGMFDSAGIRLLESFDAAESLGALMAKYASASGSIPVISAVFGKLGGGMAALASLSDFTFMEDKAKLFVTPPDAVEGNYKEKLDTSSAAFAYEKKGVIDGVGSEDAIIGSIRELITYIPGSCLENGREDTPVDDLNRTLDEGYKGSDTDTFVSVLADGQRFIKTKAGYATPITTGFIRLGGRTVGVVANTRAEGKSKKVCAKGLEKAADFIRFLNAYDIPLLTITDTEGYANGLECEKGMAKAMSKMAVALANADIPKINLLRKGISTAYLFMNSKSLSADLVYAYEDSRLEIMDAGKMADAISEGSKKSTEEIKKHIQSDLFGAGNAARRGYVDSILDYSQTRKYLIDGFEMLYSKSIPYKKHTAK